MLNFDINVDRQTENRTPISHPATSRCDKKDTNNASEAGTLVSDGLDRAFHPHRL